MCMYGSGGRGGKVDFLMGLSMLLKSLNSTLKVSQLHYKEKKKKMHQFASSSDYVFPFAFCHSHHDFAPTYCIKLLTFYY